MFDSSNVSQSQCTTLETALQKQMSFKEYLRGIAFQTNSTACQCPLGWAGYTGAHPGRLHMYLTKDSLVTLLDLFMIYWGRKPRATPARFFFNKYFIIVAGYFNRQSEKDSPCRLVKILFTDSSRVSAKEKVGNTIVFL